MSRTRRASKESQRWDDCIRWDDGIIRNLCAILDDCEFTLQKQRVRKRQKRKLKGISKRIHDNTILPNLYVIANGRSFYDGIGTNVNIVTNLHRIIVERATIGLVRRPGRDTMR